MNPTSDSRVFETSWVLSPNQLLEHKYYYARVGELLYVIQAQRGVSNDILPKAHYSEPVALTLSTTNQIEDNSLSQFNKLVAYLNKAVK